MAETIMTSQAPQEKVGTVPSGKTIQGQIDALNSNIAKKSDTSISGCRFDKKADIGFISLNGCDIATLINNGIPSGFRPSNGIRFTVYVRSTNNSNSRLAFMGLASNGTIVIYTAETYGANVTTISTGTVEGNASYCID